MELCDHSLSVTNFSRPFTEGEVLVALYQVCVDFGNKLLTCNLIVTHSIYSEDNIAPDLLLN